MSKINEVDLYLKQQQAIKKYGVNSLIEFDDYGNVTKVVKHPSKEQLHVAKQWQKIGEEKALHNLEKDGFINSYNRDAYEKDSIFKSKKAKELARVSRAKNEIKETQAKIKRVNRAINRAKKIAKEDNPVKELNQAQIDKNYEIEEAKVDLKFDPASVIYLKNSIKLLKDVIKSSLKKAYYYQTQIDLPLSKMVILNQKQINKLYHKDV